MHPLTIAHYDPEWPKIFDTLRHRLVSAVGELAIGIEHVGSTAVPGLCAKPIIDMDVIIAVPNELPETVHRLEAIGYLHRGDLGLAGREAFAAPPGPDHHLYVCIDGAEPLRQHLTYRDYLRSHPDTAEAYARLKRELAHRLASDRAAYQEGKQSFIEYVMASIEAEGPNCRGTGDRVIPSETRPARLLLRRVARLGMPS